MEDLFGKSLQKLWRSSGGERVEFRGSSRKNSRQIGRKCTLNKLELNRRSPPICSIDIYEIK